MNEHVSARCYGEERDTQWPTSRAHDLASSAAGVRGYGVYRL